MPVAEIILVLVLVLANAFFVAAEFALVKVRLSQIEQLARQGQLTARMTRHILQNLDAYLSACQFGVTLASLGLGWAGEPVVAQLLKPAAAWFGLSAGSEHYVAAPLAFVTITFLHITVGEQAPKIIAIKTAKNMALSIAVPLTMFYKVFRPFIWLLNNASNLMVRSVGIQLVEAGEQLHSEEELRLILSESAAGGELSRRERLMMENVLDLENKVARQVMVPRRDIIFLSTRKPVQEALHIVGETEYTRFPLCDGDLDRVVGMVHTKDILRIVATGEKVTSFLPLARKIPFFPETMRLDVLLREFQKNRTHVAMVVDEYGTVSGMISLENVLEELVGPIQDEFDRELPHILRRSNGRYLVDALCPLGDLVEQCHVQIPNVTADTTGGMVIELLGHIPVPGEKVRVGRHELTVLDAEPTRVRRVEVVEVVSEEPSGGNGSPAADSSFNIETLDKPAL